MTNRLKIILAVLLVVLLVLCFSFIRQYQYVRKYEAVQYHRGLWSGMRNHRSLSAQDARVLQPWMTFEYVNTIFNLPADYLKNYFHISDIEYPRITVSKYSKIEQTDSSTFIQALQSAVVQYFTRT
ncbi:MAG: hypothetical protein V4473_02475 [Patescibacteria group bacterium]